jgi:hypothetical protein
MGQYLNFRRFGAGPFREGGSFSAGRLSSQIELLLRVLQLPLSVAHIGLDLDHGRGSNVCSVFFTGLGSAAHGSFLRASDLYLCRLLRIAADTRM